MIRFTTAATMVALACPLLVRAASFDVPVSGTHTASYDAAVFPGHCPGPDVGECDVSTPFSGFLQVTTPDGADGTYTNGVSVSYDFGKLTDFPEFNGFLYASPGSGSVTATIVDGWLTDLSVFAGDIDSELTLSQGSLDWQSGLSHAAARAIGTYDLSSPVPEPAPAALLALAVAALALRRAATRRGADRRPAAVPA